MKYLKKIKNITQGWETFLSTWDGSFNDDAFIGGHVQNEINQVLADAEIFGSWEERRAIDIYLSKHQVEY